MAVARERETLTRFRGCTCGLASSRNGPLSLNESTDSFGTLTSIVQYLFGHVSYGP